MGGAGSQGGSTRALLRVRGLQGEHNVSVHFFIAGPCYSDVSLHLRDGHLLCDGIFFRVALKGHDTSQWTARVAASSCCRCPSSPFGAPCASPSRVTSSGARCIWTLRVSARPPKMQAASQGLASWPPLSSSVQCRRRQSPYVLAPLDGAPAARNLRFQWAQRHDSAEVPTPMASLKAAAALICASCS